MTKYEKLKEQKDNFVKAAAKAKDNFMIDLWLKRAAEVQAKIDGLTMEKAAEEVSI